MGHGKFVTTINCIDGRVQDPVSRWMKKKFGADYVDMITEPGPDKILTQGLPERVELNKQKVMISVNVHGSTVVAVAAHHDCAGNPVSKEDHFGQIGQCVDIIKSWGLPVKVVGLWVNEEWQVELVSGDEA